MNTNMSHRASLYAFVLFFSFSSTASADQWIKGELTTNDFERSLPWGVGNPRRYGSCYYTIENAVSISRNSKVALHVQKYEYVDPLVNTAGSDQVVVDSIVCIVTLDGSQAPRRLRPNRLDLGFVSSIQRPGFLSDDELILHVSSEPNTKDINSTWLWNITNDAVDDFGYIPTRTGWASKDAAIIMKRFLPQSRAGRHIENAPDRYYTFSSRATARNCLAVVVRDKLSMVVFKTANSQVGFVFASNDNKSEFTLIEDAKNLSRVCFPKCDSGKQSIVPIAVQSRDAIRVFDCTPNGLTDLSEFSINDDWNSGTMRNPILVSSDSEELAFLVRDIKDGESTRDVLLAANKQSGWKLREFSSVGIPYSIEQETVLSTGASEVFSNSIRSGVSSFRVRWSFRDFLTE